MVNIDKQLTIGKAKWTESLNWLSHFTNLKKSEFFVDIHKKRPCQSDHSAQVNVGEVFALVDQGAHAVVRELPAPAEAEIGEAGAVGGHRDEAGVT